MKKNKIDKKSFRQKILENIFKGPAEDYVKKYRVTVLCNTFNKLIVDCVAIYGDCDFVSFLENEKNKIITDNALDEIKDEKVGE